MENASSLVKRSTAKLTQTEFDDMNIEAFMKSEERQKKHSIDGFTYGTSYFIRHCKRAMREHNIPGAVGSALAAPVAAVPVAICAMTLIGLGINAVESDRAADHAKMRVPSKPGLQKWHAYKNLGSAQSALTDQIKAMAEHLLATGSLDAEQIRSLQSQLAEDLQAFELKRSEAAPRLRHSTRLRSAVKQLHQAKMSVVDTLVAAALNELLVRLPPTTDATKSRLLTGALNAWKIEGCVDGCKEDWKKAIRWLNGLSKTERPASRVIARATAQLNRRVAHTRKFVNDHV